MFAACKVIDSRWFCIHWWLVSTISWLFYIGSITLSQQPLRCWQYKKKRRKQLLILTVSKDYRIRPSP